MSEIVVETFDNILTFSCPKKISPEITYGQVIIAMLFNIFSKILKLQFLLKFWKLL